MDAVSMSGYESEVRLTASRFIQRRGDDDAAAARLELASLHTGLEGLAHGVALIDGESVVRYANAAARVALKHLDLHQGLWAEAIRRVCERGRRELVEVCSDAQTAFAALVPVAVARGHWAFVTFGRQELCGAIELQMFSSRHGLTLTEAAVLRELTRGLQAEDIARLHGVARSTVLTQIAAIRHKTGTHSVRQLLDTLSRMPPLTPFALRTWAG
jgi:DNA-binding CsgD family transcriptional regulator